MHESSQRNIHIFHFHLLRVMALDFKIMRVWLVVAFFRFSRFHSILSRSYLFICLFFFFVFSRVTSMPVRYSSTSTSMPKFVEIEREMIFELFRFVSKPNDPPYPPCSWYTIPVFAVSSHTATEAWIYLFDIYLAITMKMSLNDFCRKQNSR